MNTLNCKIIEILNLTDIRLVQLSRDNTLSLSLREMKTLQNYFQKLQRNPTDVELETIAQTWSEHCKHKTLTGHIEYIQEQGNRKTKTKYDNVLKETIFKATTELAKPWCLSVFKDNAGIIEFDNKNAAAFKVETHNHPSALEPYGGSATGIGGVIRDILGVGLGAKPLANTDVFCFGNINLPQDSVPSDIHHPKRIMKGVVSGVRDYGNKMGIPTVNGAVYFDEGYIGNPLVYCGTMGILPKNKIEKTVCPGDLVLLVGGKTGRDGIHGATFSSIRLNKESDVRAVQIGNPIVEKKVLDALLKARDMNLYSALTDCGAGGLSSAVGELGEKTGVKIQLEKVPLKYDGLSPWEIWISEAQERMVLSVPAKNRNKILEIFKQEEVEAVYIGEFTDDKRLILYYNEDVVADIDMEFLHDGIPKPLRAARYKIIHEIRQKPVKISADKIAKSLKAVLSDLNVCSKEWIIRQYDHEVQGQTVIKPLHGSSIEISGPGDASVINPFTIVKGTKKGIVLSCGMNPQYGKINPYKMAASAIEESLRNAVCVGADIEKIALLDNFCWGNTNKPEILGSLIRSMLACYDMSKAFGTPFISGKDSLHNEYSIDGERYSIPSSLLVSAIGIIEDISKTVTMPFKEKGNKVILLGLTRNELGGSIFSKINKIKAGMFPEVFPKESLLIMKKIHEAIGKGIIQACHDLSEGGLAVAASEMAFSSTLGVKINIDAVLCKERIMPAEILFSESNGRFLVEIKHQDFAKFKNIFKKTIYSEIGIVEEENIIFESKKNKILIQESTKDLYEIWTNPLKNL
ncbi:MAG: phosphoribosylformylglycinamidine synthase subunit PurL [Elusimicrobiota bacterium]|nr:phosphoribosylformylglycinamidine synthase subunit PurL [Elusimicrobiota bacterium]